MSAWIGSIMPMFAVWAGDKPHKAKRRRTGGETPKN